MTTYDEFKVKQLFDDAEAFMEELFLADETVYETGKALQNARAKILVDYVGKEKELGGNAEVREAKINEMVAAEMLKAEAAEQHRILVANRLKIANLRIDGCKTILRCLSVNNS